MEELTCRTVRQSLWGYQGNHPDGDSHGIALHLSLCRACERHFGEIRSLRTGLKHLPHRSVPSMLSTQLSVLASRERARQIHRRNFRSWAAEQASRAKLFFDNLLKPFA